ncbi:MAG: DUF975 family protein [Prevotellaceae bacterium]|jgi:uncharacterized membrane protein|nr:DUF975 family protein [Prevotellaceae bacterium]
MITENKILMAQARASLSGRWTVAVCAMLVYGLLLGVASGILQFSVFKVGLGAAVAVQYILFFAIASPFMLGLATFFLALSRGEQVRIEQIFAGFNRFGTALAANLLVVAFTLLWMLLLIVPGIIASISYSQTFYILADDPGMDAMSAISKSKKMMRGYKWKYFCLGLRFIGWVLLGILTLGIGFFWLTPYMQTSFAKFYDDVKTSYSE